MSLILSNNRAEWSYTRRWYWNSLFFRL